MALNEDTSQQVKRVTLPSGKSIEVVYFGGARQVTGGPTVRGPDAADLHVCPSCESELVYPIDWSEAGAKHWEVELRCPECEWLGAGVFSQQAVDRFDEELDRGTEQIADSFHKLVRANMEEEIEVFVAALQADLILPEDF